MLRAMRTFLGLLCGLGLLPACGDAGCEDYLGFALELHITAPEGLHIDKVTAERTSEEECSFVRNKTGSELMYACYEQGGGSADYVVRLYSGGEEIYKETVAVEADSCHVKERVQSYIDLTL
jgi:hypothetical protein